MGAVRVETQPTALVGLQYTWTEPEQYEWFEFRAGGAVYAVAGLAVIGDEAWMYWRILEQGILAWRDLKKNAVPQMRAHCRERGVRRVFVSTDDLKDVNFISMTGFMGFVPVLTVAMQEIGEEENVR
ncbi:hypothetical protein [Salidesulfovibrio brasiliensis]|uniref:hypothetical protein n=1 Tax=Salidesulfovibrio brasiliensis TaxID=221711 RepID=UPI0006D11EFF|nr:hypothetical protein [Salidesulfovibrio brasiliensis]